MSGPHALPQRSWLNPSAATYVSWGVARPRRAAGIAAPIMLAAALYVAAAPAAASPGESCLNPLPIPVLPFFHHDTTTRYQDDVRPPPGTCGPINPWLGLGPDVVFQFQSFAQQPESVVVSVVPHQHWDVAIYAYADNCLGSCVGVANANGPGGSETFALAVDPLRPYFFVVDGVGGDGGPFTFFCASQLDTLCRKILPFPLLVTLDDVEKEGFILKRRASNNPTHVITPLADCSVRYQVPDPAEGPLFGPPWITYTSAEGTRFLGMSFAAAVTAAVWFEGDYVVFSKNDVPGAVPCWAQFGFRGFSQVATAPPEGFARARCNVHVDVQPFFTLPGVLFDDARSCVTDEDSPAPCRDGFDCSFRSPRVMRRVPVGEPQSIELNFFTSATARAVGAAEAALVDFDLLIECADPPEDGQDSPPTRRPVTFRVRRAGAELRPAQQKGLASVPSGYTSSFFPTAAEDLPTGLAWNSGPGFAAGLYLPRRTAMQPAPTGATVPDTCELLRFTGGPLASFPSGAVIAPSDLAFDPGGGFGGDLYAAVVDSFRSGTGQPAPGGGAVVSVSPAGTVAPFADGLDSPVALEFADGPGWDGNLYVAENLGGEVKRVLSTGVVEPFLAGRALPIDLLMGSGDFGDRLYLAETDTLFPDTIPHSDAGRIVSFDSGGGELPLVSGLHQPTSLAQGDPSGPFGNYLYVALYNLLDADGLTIPATGRIVRVDPAGVVTPFADSLEQPMRLEFSTAGRFYVAVAGGLVEIRTSSTSVEPSAAGPGRLGLDAVPNPSRGGVWLRFTLPRPMRIHVEVLDPAGRRVARAGAKATETAVTSRTV